MKAETKRFIGLAFGGALTFAVMAGAVVGTTAVMNMTFPKGEPTGEPVEECRLYGKYTDC